MHDVLELTIKQIKRVVAALTIQLTSALIILFESFLQLVLEQMWTKNSVCYDIIKVGILV